MASLHHKESSEIAFDFHESTDSIEANDIDRTYSYEEIDYEIDQNQEEDINESDKEETNFQRVIPLSNPDNLLQSLSLGSSDNEDETMQDAIMENNSTVNAVSDEDLSNSKLVDINEEVSSVHDAIGDESQSIPSVEQNDCLNESEKVAWGSLKKDSDPSQESYEENDDARKSKNDWQRWHPSHQSETFFESAESSSDSFVDQNNDLSILKSGESGESSEQILVPDDSSVVSNYEDDKSQSQSSINNSVKQIRKTEERSVSDRSSDVKVNGQRRNSEPTTSRSAYSEVSKNYTDGTLTWTKSVPSRIPYRTTKKLESRNKKIMKTMKEIDNRIAINNGTSTSRRFSQPNILPNHSSSTEQQESIDRLYRKALDLKHAKENRRESLRVENELKGCTFRPRTNANNKSKINSLNNSHIPVETRLLSAREKYESNRRASLQSREQMDAIICTFSPDISISNQMLKDNNTRSTDKPIYDRLYEISKNEIVKSRRNSAKAPPECTFSPVLEATKVFNQKHLNDTNYLTPDQRREQLYHYGKLKINYERELEDSKKPARKAHNDDHIECTFFPVTNHARGRELRSRLQRSQPL